MPESDETKEFKKLVDTKPDKRKFRQFKDPRVFARFLIDNAPGYVWLDGVEVKKKFPKIKTSTKKLNEFMNSTEFREEVLEYVPDVNKVKAGNMFNMLLLKYYKGQMEDLDIPHHKALVTFGQISGKYDPVSGVRLYDGDKMDKEREKKAIEEALNAYLNKITRENKAKKEGESNGE